MVTSSHLTRFKFSSPPTLPKAANTNAAPSEDNFQKAQVNEKDNNLRKTMLAMAGLAATLAPHAANAQAAEPQIVETVIEPQVTEEASVELNQESDQSFTDKAKDLKERLDPSNYFDDYETKIGDYNFRLRPLDIGLRPRWKDGGPALRLKGDFLETSLDKSVELEGGWNMRQGVRAKLRGEISTYEEPELDLQAGVFREYTGTIGEDYDARFSADFGIRQRFMGEEEGLRGGVSLRQEIEGGDYEFMGHDFALYAEGRQGAFYNFETGNTDLNYRFMAGPKKDFDIKLLGKKGTLTVTVGPEIKGSTENEPFDLGVKSKFRLRF